MALSNWEEKEMGLENTKRTYSLLDISLVCGKFAQNVKRDFFSSL